MNHVLLSPACALLGTLLFASSGGTVARSEATGSVTRLNEGPEVTIVVRYDPETIYLTNSLVSPLCSRVVKLAREASPDTSVAMRIQHMDANELQPKGVFLCRAQLRWDGEAGIPSDELDGLLTDGIEQLRGALSDRLMGARVDELNQRIDDVNEAMVRESAEFSDVLARLAASEAKKSQVAELATSRSDLDTSAIERETVQLQLLDTIHSIDQLAASLKMAEAQLNGSTTELERAKLLFDSGSVSQAELRKAEQSIEQAKFDVSVAEADLAARQMSAETMQRRFKSLEDRISDQVGRIEVLEKTLGSAILDPQAAVARAAQEVELKLQRDLIQADLRALKAEKLRLFRERDMLTQVRIERW